MGLSLIGITYALSGGDPACAMKLVKPDRLIKIPPNHLGGGALSSWGGNTSFCAKKTSVEKPTIPATAWGLSSLKDSVPKKVPSRPKGTMNLSKDLSTCALKTAMPVTSKTINIGIMIATACGTLTLKAIKGTAKEPNPEPNPLLLIPINKTAGIATA